MWWNNWIGKAPHDRYGADRAVSVVELVRYVTAQTRNSVDAFLDRRQTPTFVPLRGEFADWSLGTLSPEAGEPATSVSQAKPGR